MSEVLGGFLSDNRFLVTTSSVPSVSQTLRPTHCCWCYYLTLKNVFSSQVSSVDLRGQEHAYHKFSVYPDRFTSLRSSPHAAVTTSQNFYNSSASFHFCFQPWTNLYASESLLLISKALKEKASRNEKRRDKPSAHFLSSLHAVTVWWCQLGLTRSSRILPLKDVLHPGTLWILLCHSVIWTRLTLGYHYLSTHGASSSLVTSTFPASVIVIWSTTHARGWHLYQIIYCFTRKSCCHVSCVAFLFPRVHLCHVSPCHFVLFRVCMVSVSCHLHINYFIINSRASRWRAGGWRSSGAPWTVTSPTLQSGSSECGSDVTRLICVETTGQQMFRRRGGTQ